MRIHATAILCALGLGAVAGYHAVAQRAIAPAPPVVATVRMDALFDGLQQYHDAKAEVARLEATLNDERRQREEHIRSLERELEETVAAEKRRELEDQIGYERLRFQFWYREAATELDIEQALRLQNVYSSVRQAAAALAAAEGYDLVIVNDETDQLPFDREAQVPVQVQVLQQIRNRKMLLVNDALDITDDLIQRMNNAFRQKN